MSGEGMYGRLLRFLRPHLWRMVGTIASNVAAAVLDVFSFTLLIPFLDRFFNTHSQSGLLTALQQRLLGTFVTGGDPIVSLERLAVVIIIAVVAKNAFVWLGGLLGTQLQEYVTRDLRDALYRHLQRLPLAYFTRTKTGQILTRVISDTATTKQIITQAVTQSLQASAVVATTLVALLIISWRLTLLSLAVVPVFVLGVRPLLSRLRRGHRHLGDQYGDMTSAVQETVSGIRLVKSFRAEGYEERRFVEASHQFAAGMVRVNRIARLATPVTETTGTLITAVILLIGAREVLVTKTLSGAALIGFLILVMRLLQPLKQLVQVPAAAQASLAAADRVFEVLDEPTETALDRGTRTDARLSATLEFDRVWFSYEREPVLIDVSFVARRGEVVALVGSSGAGKSTLVDLIPRFYEPTRGAIRLDGVDTREFRLDALRALTGIVSQDTVLFNDTVRANIAYAAPGKFSPEQIQAAARAANAHEFISELPHGYDTVLGERGTRLSGGQRQRIAIARALLTDPPILILDEATSALDTESERSVQEAIDRLLAGRTVFVIAHRLSTIVHADQILVLERGRVVERGTHAELVARGGVYGRLHALQFDRRPAPAAV